MSVQIIRKKINRQELKKISQETFGEMVKAVIDVKKEIIALGGELHADGEALLLRQDSDQKDLWGINLYLDKPKEQRIEFSALINIRPSLGNRSMKIQNSKIKAKIKKIVDKLIE